ncbi:BZ3500_MvSof-1268-A1-R1_Chr7-1g09291 [Microbotryum saponariae]|uniref:BZ3500_MvSof-1268-A1-R1_Chr7-1g09291 protein n=1 Tax=Microbotryum saponariae TaxID=289078 RepID=A0A2X0L8M1_9BASI|nr:BZ3501_MvSof-1269-A2-R1_Chr7-1g08996 [Microbotryum saponariae]SDA03171.1 BZ3500_MvSof-1268-A1-R1_Chr7-1g09291 [Microbotryum saponariae]
MNAVKSRLTQRCTYTTLRHASSSAIDRLHLDINAGAYRDESNAPKAAHQQTITRSKAATIGQATRWDVDLPIELVRAVDQLVDQYEGEKSSIRTSALELYERLRSTSSLLPNHVTTPSPSYTPLNSLAYLSGLMPSVYAATVHVLEMTRQRIGWLKGGEGEWVPNRVVEFGSGTGSGAWAARRVWKDSEVEVEYVGLDKDRSMVELGSRIIGALPKRMVDLDLQSDETEVTDGGEDPSPTTMTTTMSAKMHQLAIPASVSSFARLGIPLNPKSQSSKSWNQTLVLSSFSLGDLSTREKRKEFVRSMWETGAKVIVIVERGTPRGSRIVKDAREQLLMYGARDAEKIVSEEGSEKDMDSGCFVLAPCAHDGACPLHHSINMFCHFAQRGQSRDQFSWTPLVGGNSSPRVSFFSVRSPAFHRATKHSNQGHEIARFSYVVIKRGTRPSTPPPAPLFTKDLLSTSLVADSSPPAPTTPSTSTRWTWPRIISPPSKRSGHIILDVCSPPSAQDRSSSASSSSSGQIERHIIPKSQGRQAYYDARKSSWGDSFPHPPKNGAVPIQIHSDGLKLGKTKKEPRTEKQGWKEKGRKGWKRKEREAQEMQDFGEVLGGDEADGTGVREFQLNLGEDEKLYQV